MNYNSYNITSGGIWAVLRSGVVSLLFVVVEEVRGFWGSLKNEFFIVTENTANLTRNKKPH